MAMPSFLFASAAVFSIVSGTGIVTWAPTCTDWTPKLWRITASSANDTYIYLQASSNTRNYDGKKIPTAIQNVLTCADSAYFEHACALNSPAMGNYMEHCRSYPPASVKKGGQPANTIPERLGNLTTQNVIDALQNVISPSIAPFHQRPSKCIGFASFLGDQLGSVVDTPGSHLALLPLYLQSIAATNAATCDPAKPATYEAWLREYFDNEQRPVFGLQDIGEYCASLMDRTIKQDEDLAQNIIELFGTKWDSEVRLEGHRAVESDFDCGVDMPAGYADLISSHRGLMGQSEFAQTLQKIITKHQKQTVLVSIDIERLGSIDIAGLTKHNFQVEAIDTNHTIHCMRSTDIKPGAAQRGLCLSPPFKTHEASCLSFTSAFAQKMKNLTNNETFESRTGAHSLYGRTRNSESCNKCTSSAGKCSCEVVWGNTKPFEDLCATPIDGISGRVLEMDLTRNPGSTATDKKHSEKSIKSITQECYASTCDTAYLEEMALRSWYAKVRGLPDGTVKLRTIGEVDDSKSGQGSGQPNWMFILLGVLGVALLCLAGFFIMKNFGGAKGAQKKKRGVQKKNKQVEEAVPEEGLALNQVAPQQSAFTPVPNMATVIHPPSFQSPVSYFTTPTHAYSPVQSIPYAQPVVTAASSFMHTPLQAPLSGSVHVPGAHF